MQLNFVGLLVLGGGLLLLALGINGSYKTFGQSLASSIHLNPANAIEGGSTGTKAPAPTPTDSRITGR